MKTIYYYYYYYYYYIIIIICFFYKFQGCTGNSTLTVVIKLQSQTFFPCNTKEKKHLTVCINKKNILM